MNGYREDPELDDSFRTAIGRFVVFALLVAGCAAATNWLLG